MSKEQIRIEAARAPWVLKITEQRNLPPPVFIVKKRFYLNARSTLRGNASLYGPQLQRCLPVIRGIASLVCDRKGNLLELHRFFDSGLITFRGNLPLDSNAGSKLALIFGLQKGVEELDRVELIARRVKRFTRDEAAYWYSRISTVGEPAKHWAAVGMQIMLAGPPGVTSPRQKGKQ